MTSKKRVLVMSCFAPEYIRHICVGLMGVGCVGSKSTATSDHWREREKCWDSLGEGRTGTGTKENKEENNNKKKPFPRLLHSEKSHLLTAGNNKDTLSCFLWYWLHVPTFLEQHERNRLQAFSLCVPRRQRRHGWTCQTGQWSPCSVGRPMQLNPLTLTKQKVFN